MGPRKFWWCPRCYAKYGRKWDVRPWNLGENAGKCMYCAFCDARCWIHIDYDDIVEEKCNCYVQACAKCSNTLCSCTNECAWNLCPWCNDFTHWYIVPPELFEEPAA